MRFQKVRFNYCHRHVRQLIFEYLQYKRMDASFCSSVKLGTESAPPI